MKIFKIILFILLIPLTLEAGLQLKSFFKRYSNEALVHKNGVNVLVIGDSVLGNKGEPESVFTLLEKKINEDSDLKINLIDASYKAHYSAQANFEADELIKKYNPDVSIILLGGSDYSEAKLETSSPLVNSINFFKNVFYKTYLYKLAVNLTLQFKNSQAGQNNVFPERRMKSIEGFKHQEALYKSYLNGDLPCGSVANLASLRSPYFPEDGLKIAQRASSCVEKMPANAKQSTAFLNIGRALRFGNKIDQAITYFYKSIPSSTEPELGYSLIFWASLEKMDCPAMISAYENVLKITEPHRRMLWLLRRCFAEYGKEDEGAKFFADLTPRLKDTKNLSMLLSQSLVKGNQVDLSSINPGDNEYYITQLQIFKNISLKEEANALFRKRNFYIENDLFRIDHKNYRELIKKLSQNGKKVIVLQYANQPDWPVLEAIAPLDGDVSFLSLGKVFEKNLDKHSILDFFTEDFVHLNIDGARVVADELKNVIKETIQGSSDEN